MATTTDIIRRYQRLKDSHIDELWKLLLKKGVKGGYLRDILMFYLQHEEYPPPPQEVFEPLLFTFTAKSTTKKMRNVILHILEEICPYLESSIIQTICFTPNTSTVAHLLNCVLVGRFLPALDETCMNRLVSLLMDSALNVDERGRLLSFLVQAAAINSSCISQEAVAAISQQMANWLSTTAAVSSSRQHFGSSSEPTHSSEVFTVLSTTGSSSMSEPQQMSVWTFSVLRRWLKYSGRSSVALLDAAREVSTVVAEQSLRPGLQERDCSLQKAMQCEVLDLSGHLVALDPTHGPHALTLVKRLHAHANEHFLSDHRDISVLVRALQFLLDFGDATGYTPQHLCEQFLKDTVCRCYSSSMAAWDVTQFLYNNRCKLAPLLARYFPNVLKLAAYHPSCLLEEFLVLVLHCVTGNTVSELFESLVDLPLLSATLCVQKAAVMLSSELATLAEKVHNPKYHPAYVYMLRAESGQHVSKERLAPYMSLMADLTSHPLVETCSQVAPLLLDTLLSTVIQQPNHETLSVLLPVILRRLQLVYCLPRYFEAVGSIISHHLDLMICRCPHLVTSCQPSILDFLSVFDNASISPDCYTLLVWAIGEFSTCSLEEEGSLSCLLRYYECLECTLYESLGQLAARVVKSEGTSYRLLNLLSGALAKLASRCEELIPRALLCLRKVGSQVVSNTPAEWQSHSRIVYQRVNELLAFLHNPNVSWAVLSSSQQENPAMTAVVHVLSSLPTC